MNSMEIFKIILGLVPKCWQWFAGCNKLVLDVERNERGFYRAYIVNLGSNVTEIEIYSNLLCDYHNSNCDWSSSDTKLLFETVTSLAKDDRKLLTPMIDIKGRGIRRVDYVDIKPKKVYDRQDITFVYKDIYNRERKSTQKKSWITPPKNYHDG